MNGISFSFLNKNKALLGIDTEMADAVLLQGDTGDLIRKDMVLITVGFLFFYVQIKFTVGEGEIVMEKSKLKGMINEWSKNIKNELDGESIETDDK